MNFFTATIFMILFAFYIPTNATGPKNQDHLAQILRGLQGAVLRPGGKWILFVVHFK
jgi:hypothetical protein